MLDLDLTFVWVFIDFIVIYVILNFVLFKPLGKHMRERSKRIADDIESAQKAKAESESLREEYNRQLESAIEERRRILDEARKKAASEAEKYIAEAKNEAAALLSKSRETAKKEHESMLADLQDEIVSLSIAAASKIMSENMDSEKNRALAESFIEMQYPGGKSGVK